MGAPFNGYEGGCELIAQIFKGMIFEHRRILKNHLSWILNMKEYVKEILYGQ